MEGWRDVSGIMSAYYFCWRPRFSYQHSQVGPQPPVTIVLEVQHQYPLLASMGSRYTSAQILAGVVPINIKTLNKPSLNKTVVAWVVFLYTNDKVRWPPSIMVLFSVKCRYSSLLPALRARCGGSGPPMGAGAPSPVLAVLSDVSVSMGGGGTIYKRKERPKDSQCLFTPRNRILFQGYSKDDHILTIFPNSIFPIPLFWDSYMY